MKTLYALLIAMSGCMEPFDVTEYIESSCVGDSDRVWYISADFDIEDMELICDGIDDVNSVFDSDIQVCGVVDSAEFTELRVFQQELAKAPDGDYTVGRFFSQSGGDIHLWTNRFRHDDHFLHTVKHELGHYLRLDYKHTIGKYNIMSEYWNGTVDFTKRDISFIEGGM